MFDIFTCFFSKKKEKKVNTETKLMFVLDKMSWRCFWSQIQMAFMCKNLHLVFKVMDKKKW